MGDITHRVFNDVLFAVDSPELSEGGIGVTMVVGEVALVQADVIHNLFDVLDVGCHRWVIFKFHQNKPIF